MNATAFHLAILRSAALLAPEHQRAEWLAEWRSELWHAGDEPRATHVTAFCMGAFKDAFWLRRHGTLPRSYGVLHLDVPPPPVSFEKFENFPVAGIFQLESPVLCLSLLGVLAAIAVSMAFLLPTSRGVLLGPPYPDAGNLAMLSPANDGSADRANGLFDAYPSVSVEQFQLWKHPMDSGLSGVAFYLPTVMQTQSSSAKQTKLFLARTSADLFRLLGIPIPSGPGREATLILTRAALNTYFNGDPRTVGRELQIGGAPALVSGILPTAQWTLPANVDGWLLENDIALAALPADANGFALARFRSSMGHHAAGISADRFTSIDLPDRGRWVLLRSLLIEFFVGFVLLPITTSISSLGDYPGKTSIRRWLFLAAKILLVLPIVMFGALDIGSTGSTVSPIALWLAPFGGLLAMRWVLTDQRERCPVCLRLLANPVRIGQSSRILLEWNGTELMCLRGHGLLHVPERPAIWFSGQRWVNFDPSWSGLFP
jgi:hypothetical protein